MKIYIVVFIGLAFVFLTLGITKLFADNPQVCNGAHCAEEKMCVATACKLVYVSRNPLTVTCGQDIEAVQAGNSCIKDPGANNVCYADSDQFICANQYNCNVSLNAFGTPVGCIPTNNQASTVYAYQCSSTDPNYNGQ